jgi:hypothetical protein
LCAGISCLALFAACEDGAGPATQQGAVTDTSDIDSGTPAGGTGTVSGGEEGAGGTQGGGAGEGTAPDFQLASPGIVLEKVKRPIIQTPGEPEDTWDISDIIGAFRKKISDIIDYVTGEKPSQQGPGGEAGGESGGQAGGGQSGGAKGGNEYPEENYPTDASPAVEAEPASQQDQENKEEEGEAGPDDQDPADMDEMDMLESLDQASEEAHDEGSEADAGGAGAADGEETDAASGAGETGSGEQELEDYARDNELDGDKKDSADETPEFNLDEVKITAGDDADKADAVAKGSALPVPLSDQYD